METVPYFIIAGRQNYSRFTPVYLVKMKELEKTQPAIFEHMMHGGLWYEDHTTEVSIRYQQTKPWSSQ